MKKMIILLSTAAVALTFSLFSLGCAGNNSMDNMDSKVDTMHPTTMDSTKGDMNKPMADTMDNMKGDNKMYNSTDNVEM